MLEWHSNVSWKAAEVQTLWVIRKSTMTIACETCGITLDIWNKQEFPITELLEWVAFNISITTFFHTIQGQIQQSLALPLSDRLRTSPILLAGKKGLTGVENWACVIFWCPHPILALLILLCFTFKQVSGLGLELLSQCTIQRKYMYGTEAGHFTVLREPLPPT